MKKLLALILAAIMLMSACSAFAEAEKIVLKFDDSTNISLVLPEGYTAATKVSEEGILQVTVIKDEESVNMLVVVAADAEYDEAKRLNDLTDDEKKEFAADVAEDLDNEPWTIKTSGYGTEAIVIDEQDGGYDIGIVASVYYGYDVLIYFGYNDGHTLTDADIDFAMQFFSDLWFEVAIPE